MWSYRLPFKTWRWYQAIWQTFNPVYERKFKETCFPPILDWTRRSREANWYIIRLFTNNQYQPPFQKQLIDTNFLMLLQTIFVFSGRQLLCTANSAILISVFGTQIYEHNVTQSRFEFGCSHLVWNRIAIQSFNQKILKTNAHLRSYFYA